MYVCNLDVASLYFGCPCAASPVGWGTNIRSTKASTHAPFHRQRRPPWHDIRNTSWCYESPNILSSRLRKTKQKIHKDITDDTGAATILSFTAISTDTHKLQIHHPFIAMLGQEARRRRGRREAIAARAGSGRAPRHARQCSWGRALSVTGLA